MERKFRYFLSVALAIILILSCTGNQNKNRLLDSTVKTKYGMVKGAMNENQTVTSFKGIPYAASPVGDLRWRGHNLLCKLYTGK